MTSQCMKLVLVSFTLATCTFNVCGVHVLREAQVDKGVGHTQRRVTYWPCMVPLNPLDKTLGICVSTVMAYKHCG